MDSKATQRGCILGCTLLYLYCFYSLVDRINSIIQALDQVNSKFVWPKTLEKKYGNAFAAFAIILCNAAKCVLVKYDDEPAVEIVEVMLCCIINDV